MNTANYGVYGSESKQFGGTFPIWKHIDSNGIEEAGGVFKVVSSFAAEYPVGTIIPAGAPVALSAPGGDLTILPTFELSADILVGDTKVKFKKAGTARPVKTGIYLMPAPATVATTGTAFTIGTVTETETDYEVTITADAWGHTAKAGDIFVLADKSGSGAVIAVKPTGLLRREVYIGEGATSATGASVFHGEILVDRIAPIPECVKAILPMIKFTKG